jgi:acetyl-CoA carboxylase biotin carboxyl carrier protein
MDINLVKKLVKLLSESDVDEIEIEEEGKKIRVAKHPNSQTLVHPSASTVTVPVATSAARTETQTLPPVAVSAPDVSPAVVEVPQKALYEVRSPIVGTFYRAPAPDAAPFVQVGSEISPGTVLCIIEAMKLMNEIESDVSGKVAKVMVENGQPVEFDQVLYLIDKA